MNWVDDVVEVVLGCLEKASERVRCVIFGHVWATRSDLEVITPRRNIAVRVSGRGLICLRCMKNRSTPFAYSE